MERATYGMQLSELVSRYSYSDLMHLHRVAKIEADASARFGSPVEATLWDGSAKLCFDAAEMRRRADIATLPKANGAIPQGRSTLDVEAVKERSDIIALAGRYVELKRGGHSRYQGLCPFHSEKTPSFMVFPDDNHWWCFGSCGIGGDVIDLWMRLKHLSFYDAVVELAREAGVRLAIAAPKERRWGVTL